MEDDANDANEMLITLTSDIVAAHLSNNPVTVAEVPRLISSVHAALAGLGEAGQVQVEELKPAVSIRSSVKPNHLVCLEDGKQFKTLKRHLMVDHGMTPDEYRRRWGLGKDYPMIAPDYAALRSTIAKKFALGRTPGQKRGRPRKSAG